MLSEINTTDDSKPMIPQKVRVILKISGIIYYGILFDFMAATLVLFHYSHGQAKTFWFVGLFSFLIYSAFMFRQPKDDLTTGRREVVNQLYVGTVTLVTLIGWGGVFYVTRNVWSSTIFSRRITVVMLVATVAILHGVLFRKRFPY